MRCSTLQQLPAPPAGKVGWPWTEESRGYPDLMTDGTGWPRISIVTPSYNQGEFIEETVRSVLLQAYPNLEYIIMDGGSTDCTVEILKKYDPWITYWTSGKDGGQPQAINQGFRRATGDIIGWLNSDDVYLPGALAHVGKRWSPERRDDFWIVAGVQYRDESTGQTGVAHQEPWYDVADWVKKEAVLHQQGSFWARAMFLAAGPLDETQQMGFDREYWIRLLASGYRFQCAGEFVAGCYRLHDKCKGKKHILRMRYEHLLGVQRYLQMDAKTFRRELQALHKQKAYYLVRLSQDESTPRMARVGLLLDAIRCSPVEITHRTFWGSLLRAAVPDYQMLRDRWRPVQ